MAMPEQRAFELNKNTVEAILFDLDAISGFIVNRPMGAYDIMANPLNLIHPNPVLKAGSGGQFPHAPWVDVVDLRTALTPGEEQDIIFPPSESIA